MHNNTKMCGYKKIIIGLLIVCSAFGISMSASALTTPSENDIPRSQKDIDSPLSNEIPTNPITSNKTPPTARHGKSSNSKGKRKSSPKFALFKSNKNDVSNPLLGAIINAIMQNKEVIINKMVNIAERLFSGILKEIKRFFNGIFPGIVPSENDKSSSSQRHAHEKDDNTSEGVSQRRSDTIRHEHRTPQALSNSEAKDDLNEDDETGDNTLFVMPLVDKPISYNDIVLAQRLFYDSIDAYNAWQEGRDEDSNEEA